MSTFRPSSKQHLSCAYGATEDVAASDTTSSYMDQGSALLSKYAPTIKTLFFDEDPRIAYAKKQKELEVAIAGYKISRAGLSKNMLATKIRNLQAELPSIRAQIEDLEIAETTKQVSKIAGIALLVGGGVTVLLVGNYFFAKAGTERARRRQILSGHAEA